jgi:hypothetical protein
MVLVAKVTPVGIDKDNPTRWDLSTEGVNGSVCGYALSASQAESWKEGLQLALNEQHKISYLYGLNAKQGSNYISRCWRVVSSRYKKIRKNFKF